MKRMNGKMKWAATMGLSLSMAFGCGPDGSPLRESAKPGTLATAKSKSVVDDLYSQLKQVEANIPVMPATVPVYMGTYDVLTGEFHGQDYSYSISPITHKPIRGPVTIPISGKAAIMTFDLINTNSGFTTLTVGTRHLTVTPGTQQLQFNAGAEGGAWTIQSNVVGHQGIVNFTRKGVNGAGAFTIEALPITIVYEPPQNLALTNSASTTLTEEQTSVTTMTQSNETSFTDVSQWSQMTEAASTVDKIAGALAAHYDAGSPGGVASTFLSAMSTVFGSVDETMTNGTTVNSDHSLGLTTQSQVSVAPTLKKGPGLGDVFFFYRNARVAWFMLDGEVTTTLLDPGTLVDTTAQQLKQDLADINAGTKTDATTVTKVSAATLASLIALDPTTIGTTNTRFVKEFPLSVSGGASFNQTVSHTFTETEKATKSSFTSTLKDVHAGWLGTSGLGSAESGKYTTKLTMSTEHSTTTSQTRSTSVSLSAQAGESYDVNVYFDKIFGTFKVLRPSVIIRPPCCIGGPIGPVHP